MQEIDAERRIALLRGEQLAPLPSAPAVAEVHRLSGRVSISGDGRRKRRRIVGEDDTDRDMRYAREDAERDRPALNQLQRSIFRDASLTDHAGHIQLFVPGGTAGIGEKDHPIKIADSEKEAQRKERVLEDRHTMRFSNAAGFKQDLKEKPWWENGRVNTVEVGKDAWGNEDPRRKERDQARTNTSDPMAIMRMAQRQLKEAEREKTRWAAARRRELSEVDFTARRKGGKKRDKDGLEGFSLDNSESDGKRPPRHRSSWHQDQSRSQVHRRELSSDRKRSRRVSKVR